MQVQTAGWEPQRRLFRRHRDIQLRPDFARRGVGREMCLRIGNRRDGAAVMSEKQEERQALEEIAGFVNALRKINEIATTEYRVLVEDVISGCITEELKTEKVMDGLLNFLRFPRVSGTVQAPLQVYII